MPRNLTRFAAWCLAGTLTVRMVPGADVFFDTVEGGTNGWTVAVTGDPAVAWRITQQAARSSTHAWWCGTEALGTYAGTSAVTATLTSPVIALDTNPCLFAFEERFDTENGLDDCTVQISTNGGVAWIPLASNRWGHTDWNRQVVDLAGYTGRTFRAQFRFQIPTTNLNAYAGWFLDNIQVAQKTDSDGDGLLDCEEAWSGSNPDAPDTDADGQDDGQEVLLAGTSPTNAASTLRLSSVDATNEQIRFDWSSRPGKRYSVESCSTLTGTWVTVPDVVVTGRCDTQTTFQTSHSSTNTFYRIAVSSRPAIATEGFGCDTNGRAGVYAGSLFLWGDIHAHTSNSQDAVSNELCTAGPGQALTNAMAMGLLDFVALTDHAEVGAPGGFTVDKWETLISQEKAFQTAHPTMIVLPGLEYTKTGTSGPTVPDASGHKCILFYDFDHLPEVDANPLNRYGMDRCLTPVALWSKLDSGPAAGHYMCIPHHPAKGEEPEYEGETNHVCMATDWSSDYVRADIQPLCEIYSRHGSSEMDGCEEPVNAFMEQASLAAALDRWLVGLNPAYKLGIVGSTDTHMGNPGYTAETNDNVQARLGPYTGGLTALAVTNRSRDAVWTALKNRNCYATSGTKIGLEFTAQLGPNGAPMGGTLYHSADLSSTNYAEVNLHVWASGIDTTNPVRRIQVFRNRNVIFDESNTNWGESAHMDFADHLTNDFAYYRAKVWTEATTLNTNVPSERAWSSPIWIERLGGRP